jgi:tetratricopeptide (TPR) repeat protein
MIFDTIVLITASDENAKRDALALKQFRPRRMLRFSSGAEAIEYLNAGKADIILLDAELGDMDGVKFLKLVRLNMNLKNTPVVMVTSDGRRNRVLDAIAAGCAGYILRPYSVDTFKRHVLRACQAERMTEVEELQVKEAREMVSLGNYDDAIEAFEEIVSEQNQAQKYYDLGCKYLMRQKFGQAIIAFKKAVKINDLYAEAYKGLAEAYKGKGDLDNYKTFAQKAAEVFAQFNRMEEVKDLFIEILKYDPDSPNPFNTLGVNLRRAGDLPGALHAYRRALELTPEDENIHFNMSKAYFFMGDEPKAKARVAAALAINPDFTEGRKLYLKIFGTPYPVPASPGPAKKSAGLALDRDGM